MIRLQAGDACITIDPQQGARIASLMVGDLEVLVTHTPDVAHTFFWGCYPMAPWAGRIRRGRFLFAGKEHQLPLAMPPHAIHGTTYNVPWQQLDEGVFRVDLGRDWPFSGFAVQRFRLEPDVLHMTLEIHSNGEPFPASCGWHPWFPKQLARGGPAQLDFRAESMYLRDADYLVDGAMVTPPEGPWDDCFIGVAQPVRITWPGALECTLKSDSDHWVVYNEKEHAFCVEPQTGPPDALTIARRVVTPDNPLVLNAQIGWTLL